MENKKLNKHTKTDKKREPTQKLHNCKTPIKATKTDVPAHIATPRPTASKAVVPFSRQPSNAILNFRMRKSLSSMEFRHVKQRQMKMCIPYPCDKELSIYQMQEDQMTEAKKNLSYFLQDKNPKEAGMKIFCCIMLNAWRKRREEVKRLNNDLSVLKIKTIKTKNQLHVFNSLFHVEQKRNEDLSAQLKRSSELVESNKLTCEELSSTVELLTIEKNNLQHLLQVNEDQVNNLKAILLNVSADLQRNKNLRMELQDHLVNEEQKVRDLENRKNDILLELSQVKQECESKTEQHAQEMAIKNLELQLSEVEIQHLGNQIKEFKLQLSEIPKFRNVEEDLKKEIQKLRHQVDTLQGCLAATLGSRVKACWNHALTYQRHTFHMLQWMAYLVLPAAIPPKITPTTGLSLSVSKALSIVRH